MRHISSFTLSLCFLGYICIVSVYGRATIFANLGGTFDVRHILTRLDFLVVLKVDFTATEFRPINLINCKKHV